MLRDVARFSLRRFRMKFRFKTLHRKGLAKGVERGLLATIVILHIFLVFPASKAQTSTTQQKLPSDMRFYQRCKHLEPARTKVHTLSSAMFLNLRNAFHPIHLSFNRILSIRKIWDPSGSRTRAGGLLFIFSNANPAHPRVCESVKQRETRELHPNTQKSSHKSHVCIIHTHARRFRVQSHTVRPWDQLLSKKTVQWTERTIFCPIVEASGYIIG